MKTVIIGLGGQGRKRIDIAGGDVIATVDSIVSQANYSDIKHVPLEDFNAALICTPDQIKLDILVYLISHGKHVLVEKPLLFANPLQIRRISETAQSTGATCYTAYNHRFEPNIMRLKNLLENDELGDIYLAKLFYGNGTALNVRNSSWRDQGVGVLSDLGSHLLDLTLFLFGEKNVEFKPWAFNRFENNAFDYFLFGSRGKPVLELEASLISWQNSFTIDIFGQNGSAHVNGLCKWGASKFSVRKRVFPSGKPKENIQISNSPDPTWSSEYEHFRKLCRTGGTNIQNDIWINSVINDVMKTVNEGDVY